MSRNEGLLNLRFTTRAALAGILMGAAVEMGCTPPPHSQDQSPISGGVSASVDISKVEPPKVELAPKSNTIVKPESAQAAPAPKPTAEPPKPNSPQIDKQDGGRTVETYPSGEVRIHELMVPSEPDFAWADFVYPNGLGKRENGSIVLNLSPKYMQEKFGPKSTMTRVPLNVGLDDTHASTVYFNHLPKTSGMSADIVVSTLNPKDASAIVLSKAQLSLFKPELSDISKPHVLSYSWGNDAAKRAWILDNAVWDGLDMFPTPSVNTVAKANP